MSLTILSVAFSMSTVGPDAVGGAEQVLFEIDEALVHRGHRSLVIAQPESRIAGTLIPTVSLPGPVSDGTWRSAHHSVRAALASTLDRYPIDLVHMHGFDFGSYFPDKDVPVLVTLHLPLTWYRSESINTRRPRTYFHCVSRSQSKLSRMSLSLLPEIENGVRANLFRGSGIRKRDFAVSLGRICPEKGFHLALRAARQARTAMFLAGRVFPFAEHQSYFTDRIAPELDSRRRYIGPVGLRGKQRLLSAATCVIVPSTVPETSSLVAREALACGTPVVGFAGGALSETVENGRTGFLVQHAEELPDAIQASRSLNPVDCRRAAMGKFPPGRMIEAYLATYRQLLERSSRLSRVA